MQRRQALQTIGTAGAALVTLNGKSLAALGDHMLSLEELPMPLLFRRNLGWFGEVQSNKVFSVSPTIHHGISPNNPKIRILTTCGYNIKWKNGGPTDFVSTTRLADLRKGKTEQIVLDNPGWRNNIAKGLQIRYHLFPEPHNVFRIPICGKHLLVQSWEKNCKVKVSNQGKYEIAEIKSPMCSTTIFLGKFLKDGTYQEHHRAWKQQRVNTLEGNILLTINVLPDTKKWLWFAASTEFGGYSLIGG